MPITILAGRSEVRIPEKGQKIILFSKKRPDGLCSPSSLLFNWYRENFQGAEWPGCKVSHSSPSSAPRLRMCETIPLLPPPQCLHDVDREKTYNFFYYLWSFGEKLDKDPVRVKLIGNNHKD